MVQAARGLPSGPGWLGSMRLSSQGPTRTCHSNVSLPSPPAVPPGKGSKFRHPSSFHIKSFNVPFVVSLGPSILTHCVRTWARDVTGRSRISVLSRAIHLPHHFTPISSGSALQIPEYFCPCASQSRTLAGNATFATHPPSSRTPVLRDWL